MCRPILIVIERICLKRIGQWHDANLGPFLWEMKQHYTQKEEEEEEEENKEQKGVGILINTKIQIKLGKPTKGMRENN